MNDSEEKIKENLLILDEENISEITHNLSHDIGNPLTSIITYGSLIQQSQNLNIPLEKLENYAKSLLGETWKISILMEKYLMLVSKKTNASSANIKEIASRLMSRYNSRYGLNEFDLELIGFDQNISAYGDIEQICSMLCELLSNAANSLRYLKSKGEEVEFYLSLTCEINKDKNIIFEIKNLSQKHELELSELILPGISEHFISKQPIGIGLSAIHNTAARFNGYLSISEEEEIDINLPDKMNNYFISKLILPLV
jgi:nitrogen-specific signal transduction histidine kinase